MLFRSFCEKFIICRLRVFVLCVGKNFFKNSLVISCQVAMVLGLRECSHDLAFSLRENGNNFNLTISSLILLYCRVEHTSSNSLRCRYGLSESSPWNFGSSWIIPGFMSKVPPMLGITI